MERGKDGNVGMLIGYNVLTCKRRKEDGDQSQEDIGGAHFSNLIDEYVCVYASIAGLKKLFEEGERR